MHLQILFLLDILLAIVYSADDSEQDSQSPKPKLVASADGKSFYADKTIPRNWTAAGAYCDSFGMTLAEITSAEQAAALRGAYSKSDFRWEHWTAGRDVQNVKQFRWNSTDQALSSEFIELQPQVPIPYKTCVIYISLPDNESGIRFWPCDDGTFAGALCETE